MNSNCWLLMVWALLLHIVCLEIASAVAKEQYHIQTDEGPERYFRFQTHNGQFRKEKRLQDGTVIGTEAWIDAAGYLRLKDYIADKQGYRILKSKVLFVGQGTEIEDAMKTAKSVPAQSGTLVDGKNGLYSTRPNSISGDSANSIYSAPVQTLPPPTSPPTTTEKPILGYLSPAEAAKLEPTTYLGFDHYPNEVPAAEDKRTQPVAYVRPYGGERTVSNSQYDVTEKSLIQLPSIDMQPPLDNRRRRPIRPVAVAPENPSPIAVNNLGKTASQYSTPAPFYNPASNSRYYYPTSPESSAINNQQPPQSLSLDVNALEGLLPPLPPLYQRQRVPASSQAGYGTRLQPDYNEVTVTRNGFRYLLPHQYHEEQQITDSKKAGSFGYVDPFGIRRVVYYNASPDKGFIHRNHNQYVGLGAAPYDPPQPSEV